MEHRGESRHVVERDGRRHLVSGDVFGVYQLGEEIGQDGRLLAPVMPSKIVAIGLNYKDHAAEQNKPLPSEPLFFLKPSTAVIGPDRPIVLPAGVGRVDYESEVGIVIGRRAHRVTAAKAREHVLGVICANDVSARDLQKKDGRYTRAKGFDTFAPLGPCVALGFDGGPIAVEGWINGERRQASSTSQLIFPVEELIAYVSRIMTLLPGDVMITGTPSGIGPLAPGDRFTVKVEGVGELSNPVVAEDA
jgi:2-keto-4-pentenoate hydratase/2-oxohepta-3-ene-1,7-dioic acid hydratase in catechol pathway